MLIQNFTCDCAASGGGGDPHISQPMRSKDLIVDELQVTLARRCFND